MKNITQIASYRFVDFRNSRTLEASAELPSIFSRFHGVQPGKCRLLEASRLGHWIKIWGTVSIPSLQKGQIGGIFGPGVVLSMR